MLKEKGILFDETLCMGCGSCYHACKEKNNLPATNKDFLKDHLSNNTFTTVEQYGTKYARKLCMHCNEPSCVSVCLVGAFSKSATGAVLYDADKCIGCRYCMQACPHKIPRYEWATTKPRVRKCTLCDDRIKKGLLTACAEACPTEATLCGDMDELVSIAKKRLSEHPEKYYQKIYGLNEAMPEFTMRAMEKIPPVVAVGGVFLSGMYWLTKRKNQLASEEKNHTKEMKKHES